MASHVPNTQQITAILMRDLGPSWTSVLCVHPVLEVSAELLSEVTSAGGSPGLGSVLP